MREPVAEGDETTVVPVAAVVNILMDEIGEDIQARGFREDWDRANTLERLAEGWMKEDVGNRIIQFNGQDVALWEFMVLTAEALRTNILGMKLALVASELSEALETLRDVGASGVLNREGNFGEELADAHIRLFDLEHMVRQPAGDNLTDKVQVNKERPYKHGRRA